MSPIRRSVSDRRPDTRGARGGRGRPLGRKPVVRATRSGEARSDRPDPVETLERQDATRVPELVPIRHGRMLASAFTFYRGGAAIMAADLATTPSSGLRVQLCGDAHLSNFGGFRCPRPAADLRPERLR